MTLPYRNTKKPLVIATRRILRKNIFLYFREIELACKILSLNIIIIFFNIPWTLKERTRLMIYNVIILIWYSKLSRGRTLTDWALAVRCCHKTYRQENAGGTLCMPGKIYFSQKYTVLSKINGKWSRLFKYCCVNEHNFS